jgi:5'-3' exonuclease
MQNPRNVGLFPTTVEVDFNGCSENQAHKAVALVPFMDMSDLKRQFDDCLAHLESASERKRNEFGPVLIFTARGQPHGLLGIAEAPTETGTSGVQVHVCVA